MQILLSERARRYALSPLPPTTTSQQLLERNNLVRLDNLFTQIKITGLALATVAAIAGAGCSGSGTAYGGNPNPYHSLPPNPGPSPSIAPGSQIVGVNLSGEAPSTDPTYGRVLGYFATTGSINTTSQVVHVTAATNVVFQNFENGIPHTASFLGNASANGANFPPNFNGSATTSAANTVISTANFSTGTLNPGSTSLQYNSGPPGFYMFGCAFHYDSDGMRTVVIVQ
jgi:plastocyanin